MTLTNNSYERYQRQILLKQFGEQAQIKLLNSKVLIIGAGGLGCPVLQYLAAAGIGKVGIADNDIVALSNLHRQILFTTNDIGKSKVDRASAVLQKMNPDINIHTYNIRIDNSNALEVIADYDIVIDCTDNFASRYLINDACVLKNKPLIYGSIYRFEGQVAIFNVRDKSLVASANYRDLFADPPEENEVPSCDEAGVIGVLPGIIGLMMSNECIKLITGIGNPLINKLIIYNSLNNTLFETEIIPQKETVHLIPQDATAFKAMRYSFSCPVENHFIDIDADIFNQLITKEDTIVIDVREKGEKPIVSAFQHINIPMSILAKQKPIINEKNILLFCHSGIRSAAAASILSTGTNKVYNLKGGIMKWMAHQQK